MRSETQGERGEKVGGWQHARRRANARDHRMERGVNVSVEWCLSLCDGPAMNWPLVRGVSAPLLQGS